MKSKTKPKFITILALGSILGFLTTAIFSFFNFDFSNYATSILFILIGAGLMVEGQVRNFLRMTRNGLTSTEISHITAIVIGLISVIAGVVNIVGTIYGIQALLNNQTFIIVKGIISLIAIIIISLETWVVK